MEPLDFRAYESSSEASSDGQLGARKALVQELIPDRAQSMFDASPPPERHTPQFEQTAWTSDTTSAWSSAFGSASALSAHIARLSAPVIGNAPRDNTARPAPPTSPRPPEAPPAPMRPSEVPGTPQVQIPAWALRYRQGGQVSQPSYTPGGDRSYRPQPGNTGGSDVPSRTQPTYTPGRLPYRPRLDTPQPPEVRETGDAIPPGPGGQGYTGLRRAIERARQGGEPVRVLHYGASHTVAGTEARKFESLLEQTAPVDYYRQAKNGISASYPLSRKQEWLDQPIQQANPDLVVVEFGNNDGAGRINRERYAQQFEELILDIKRRAPNASIMIMGPTDGCSIVGANKGNLLPGITDVIEVQKQVAAKHGIDYYDVRQDMGGAGSVYEWRQRGLVSGDLLHFTTSGYEQLGRMRYEHLRSRINS